MDQKEKFPAKQFDPTYTTSYSLTIGNGISKWRLRLQDWAVPLKIVTSLAISLVAILFLSNKIRYANAQQGTDTIYSIEHDGVLIPFPTCNDTKFLSTFDFAYDSLRDLTIQESLKFDDNVKGKIHITRGQQSQPSDIFIRVQVGCKTPEDHSQILVLPTDNGVTISTWKPELPQRPTNLETCCFVYVVVYVRPGFLFWGNFNVETSNFDIELGSNAWFEGYHFYLSSHLGDIACAKAFDYHTGEYLTAHEMTVHTRFGSVFGNWSLGSSITIQVHLIGNVDINLMPYQWSSGPWTMGRVFITTVTGNISVRMPFDRPSQRNYTTYISAFWGSIDGELMHGASTSLNVVHRGSIDVDLLPFNVMRSYGSKILTSCFTGSTDVRVLSPVKDSYWKENPLNWTDSGHRQSYGTIRIQYPKEWWGWAQVRSEEGEIDVHGPDLKFINREKGFVSARKGYGGSFLNVAQILGTVELAIGE